MFYILVMNENIVMKLCVLTPQCTSVCTFIKKFKNNLLVTNGLRNVDLETVLLHYSAPACIRGSSPPLKGVRFYYLTTLQGCNSNLT